MRRKYSAEITELILKIRYVSNEDGIFTDEEIFNKIELGLAVWNMSLPETNFTLAEAMAKGYTTPVTWGAVGFVAETLAYLADPRYSRVSSLTDRLAKYQNIVETAQNQFEQARLAKPKTLR